MSPDHQTENHRLISFRPPPPPSPATLALHSQHSILYLPSCTPHPEGSHFHFSWHWICPSEQCGSGFRSPLRLVSDITNRFKHDWLYVNVIGREYKHKNDWVNSRNDGTTEQYKKIKHWWWTSFREHRWTNACNQFTNLWFSDRLVLPGKEREKICV